MVSLTQRTTRRLGSCAVALLCCACAQIAGLTGDYHERPEAAAAGAGTAGRRGDGASGGDANGGSDAGNANSNGGANPGTAGQPSDGGDNSSAAGQTSNGGASAGNSSGGAGANPGGGASGSAGQTSNGGGSSGVVIGGDKIRAGFPEPTAANVASCTSTMLTPPGLCPGGGQGPYCMQCLFGGTSFNSAHDPLPDAVAKAGNYAVTVKLGGPAAAQTFISAEASRGLLAPVDTAAGALAEYGFVVNVRARESQPNDNTSPAGYPGLDLFFSAATAPPVVGIGFALVGASTKPITVYVASDTTAADLTATDYAGWAQMLPEFFTASVAIANYADSAESSASFYASAGLWDAIKSHWAPGDYVMIQFGHNDKGVTDAAVQANLERYVSEAILAGVNPILLSPPARVQFQGSVEGDQSSLHAAAAEAAATAKGVPYIDLTALSTAWYNSLGSSEAALKFHANGMDVSYTNPAGATKIAALVAKAIETQKILLANYLRP